jgi:3-dehydroquinate dehydratase-1
VPDLSRSWVVAAVHSADSLKRARALEADGSAPDLLELRVDHFASRPHRLDALATTPPRALIVTVRHPREGGAAMGLDASARRGLYARFLPAATLLDVELRSLRALASTVRDARESGCLLIASYHDFRGLPSDRRLREMVSRSQDAGAAVCKVAATLRSAADVARLLAFLAAERSRLPLAVTAMGPFGWMSRPLLAAAGSTLNYGFLGRRAQVPGQWPAGLLRERIDELLAGSVATSKQAS